MKPGLSLRMSQHLALTPQLQQSIRLLQLSTLELSQEVAQMLDENPFLEREEDEADRENWGLSHADSPVSLGDRLSEVAQAQTPEDSHTALDDWAQAEVSWDGDGSVDLRADDSEWGGDAPARGQAEIAGAGQEGSDFERDSPSADSSLTAFLHRQALSLRLSPTDQAALRYLIESLNDDGYLEDSLPELARHLAPVTDLQEWEQLLHHLTVALYLLQSLEPVGVGARHLSECLGLQIKARMQHAPDNPVLATALKLCAQPLQWVAKRDVRRLAAHSGESEAQVKAALLLLTRLEPKPGRAFVSVAHNIVIPDVLVTRAQRSGTPQFLVRINPNILPKLRVHDVYANALRASKGDASAGLQQRLQEARWFIKNIQQRFDTILRVASVIVDRQKNFLVQGELAMRPLVLRDIADELGMHESTISRVTTAKYMATPQGTFELKYFFGSGLGTDGGGAASSTAVRALIRQLVAAENSVKPLSDQQLSNMLKEQGIDCARRTVAKYREALKIAPTSLRKTL
jgi:RNA polymerase sigma-54 factor